MAFRGDLLSLSEVRRLADEFAGVHMPGPEVIWPDSRGWVVASDYDLVSTYVACDEQTANFLSQREELELLRVTLSTRIDDHADEGDSE
jgi:hypothetical protein